MPALALANMALALAQPAAGLRAEVVPDGPAWSLYADGMQLVRNARVGVAVSVPIEMPEATRFVKFRLIQDGGDWDAYIGYLELGASEDGQPTFADSFRKVTPADGHVRQTNLLWRTETEGGLICPQRRGEWAEIVFPTRGPHLLWVYQVVHADDIIEVWTSPDDQTYELLTTVTNEGGLQGRWEDADAGPLVRRQFCPLKGPVTGAAFEDSSGVGRALRVDGVFEGSSLKGTLMVREFADQGLCTLSLAISNPGAEDAFLGDVVFGRATGETGGQIGLGVPATRCSVVGSDYWFGVQPMQRLDEADQAGPWWFTALGDRESRRGLAMGVDEAANVETRFRFRRVGEAIEWEAVGDCSPTGRRPLRMPPGASLQANRLSFVYRDNVFEALEAYADHVKLANGIQLHPAYGGLFTGYSSDPELETVVRLDEGRVDTLLGIVREKLQPYGLDTIKIEFEPYGSPNILDPEAYKMAEYFPDGAKALADHLRGQGFRPALQSRTFLYVRAGEPDEGEKVRAMYQRFTREWGFEYLMLDFNHTDLVNLDDTRPRTQCFRDRFRMIREAVGPDVFIEACMIAPGPVIGLADGFRPSHDFRAGNESSILPGFVNRYFLHGRVFQLDTEFYDVALWPFAWTDPPYASSLENVRSWTGLCGMLGYSVLGGGCIERTTDERFAIFTRTFPPTGRAARPLDLLADPLPAQYALEMTQGERRWWVIGLFNWSEDDSRDVTIDLARAGLDGGRAYAAFDFYQERYVGAASGQVARRLAPGSCCILHLTPTDTLPVVIGSDRHVTGAYVCDGVELDAEQSELTGTIGTMGDREASVFVLLPHDLRLR